MRGRRSSGGLEWTLEAVAEADSASCARAVEGEICAAAWTRPRGRQGSRPLPVDAACASELKVSLAAGRTPLLWERLVHASAASAEVAEGY